MPGRNRTPPGNYQVIQFLPESLDGDPGYQIKHLNEGQEQIARESELAAGRDVTAPSAPASIPNVHPPQIERLYNARSDGVVTV